MRVSGLKHRLTPLLLLAASCSRTGSDSARTYEAEGQVVSIAGNATAVTIAHEDIKGFMPAMTMLFPVKEPAVLAGIAKNDLVQFELKVAPTESWVSEIRRTGRGEEKFVAPSAAARSPGEKLDSFSLLNHNGAPVQLTDFEGLPFAMTFIFTRCPMPDYCPRFTNNFVKVQRALAGKYPGGFRLLSVTVDPEYDTPQVLEDYGKRNGADFGVWSLLTGSEDEIRKLADQAGVQFWKDGAMVTHTGICVLVRPDGTLHKIYRGNTWSARDVTQDLESLIAPSVAGDHSDHKEG